MEDLYFHPKFAEAFRLGGFRLELHYYSGCAENDYEVRVIDMLDVALPSLRLGVSDCRSLAIGLRFLEAMANASNGDAKAERTVERLRPLLINEDGTPETAALDAFMKQLDRDRRQHNREIDAERERVDESYRKQHQSCKQVAS